MLTKDGIATPVLASDELKAALEQVAQELVGSNIVVELQVA